MFEFIKHAPCPNCGSKDNLGIYEDHSYCFGCHIYVPGGDISTKSRKRDFLETVDFKSIGVCLPNDCTNNLDYAALSWLGKYGITGQEIIKNELKWSEKGIFLIKKNIQCSRLLVFPVYDQYHNLLMWSGRNFGGIGPKWIHKGIIEDVLHIIPSNEIKDTLVLVEDPVSAIKISRHLPCLPLYGNSLSKIKASRLRNYGIKYLTFWLDYDMTKQAHKQAKKMMQLFDKTKVIVTTLDPKNYNDSEIKEILNENAVC